MEHHAGNCVELSSGGAKVVCTLFALGWRVGQLVPSIAAGVGGGVGTVRVAAGQRKAGSAGPKRRGLGNFHWRILLEVLFELRLPAPH